MSVWPWPAGPERPMSVKVGDFVRWRPDIFKNAEPMEVIQTDPGGRWVSVAGGAYCSVELLEMLGSEDAGLLQVIEAQMAEIDLLVADRDEWKAECDSLDPDETMRLVGDLCIALGFDRRPQLPTGIPELDALARHAMP